MKALNLGIFVVFQGRLHNVVETLFGYLSQLFASIHPSQIYAIDSFPVELCQLQRESQCQLMRHTELKGYNASKKRYFYGFKVHMIATTQKEPVVKRSVELGS